MSREWNKSIIRLRLCLIVIKVHVILKTDKFKQLFEKQTINFLEMLFHSFAAFYIYIYKIITFCGTFCLKIANCKLQLMFVYSVFQTFHYLTNFQQFANEKEFARLNKVWEEIGLNVSILNVATLNTAFQRTFTCFAGFVRDFSEWLVWKSVADWITITQVNTNWDK